MCYTETSFDDDGYYGYYGYYSSGAISSTSSMDKSSSIRQKLVSMAMSKFKSNFKPSNSESVAYGGDDDYPQVGPSEWSCYNPNNSTDQYYYDQYYYDDYYDGNSTKLSSKIKSTKIKSTKIKSTKNLFSCPPYVADNTNSTNMNYATCHYTYYGYNPLSVNGI